MKSVVLANFKGGVGKTSAAVNLSYLAAKSGLATLLVDLDAQAAASYILRVDATSGAKAKRLAKGKRSITNAVVASDFANLDVLPASRSLRKLDLLLHDKKRKRNGSDGLSRTFDRFDHEYELIVVDAPAGIHLEVERIARSMDLVLIPVVPTTLAVETYRRFREFLEIRVPDVAIASFFSMVDRRKRMHKDIVTEMVGADGMWDVAVPFVTAVEAMAVRRLPLPAYNRKGRAPDAFRELWDKVASNLDLKGQTTDEV